MKTNTFTSPETSKFQELLDNCAKEPIHRPGRIQGHGMLLIIDRKGDRIVCASENIVDHFKLPLADVLGCSLEDLSSPAFPRIGVELKQLLRSEGMVPGRSGIPLELKGEDGSLLNVFVRSGLDDLQLLEIEPIEDLDRTNVQARLLSAFGNIRSPQLDIAKALDQAAREVKEATGFARVMIYKFHGDWHGEVVAEVCDTGVGTFMGLHFPASDIPPQARELYTRNHTRQIPDVDSATHALVAAPGHEKLVEIDLSNVQSRAVSPVHIQYLRNMGVGASFSISIIAHGRLWGLIACHHPTPLVLSHAVRSTCLLIGQLLAVSLEADLEREKNVVNDQSGRALQDLTEELRSEKAVEKIIADHASTIMRLFKADALWSNIGGITSLGHQPSTDELVTMIGLMDDENGEPIIATDRMGEFTGTAFPFAGLLGIRLQPSTQEFLFILRRERKQTVSWAGLPQKSDQPFQQNGFTSLGPRKSFQIWEEDVRGRSEKWSLFDRSLANKVRILLLDALNQRAAQMRILNERLKEAYEEMEAFSYTISHDLRVPLNSIANYAEMITEDLQAAPGSDISDLVKGITRGTERMARLIDHVLEHARLGKLELKKRRVPMMELITDIRSDLEAKYRGRATKHRFILEKVPDIFGDPILIMQVFSNLISNAYKYSQHAAEPLVRVSGTEANDRTIYTVVDNGIGIDMKHADRIFQLFRRSDNVSQYEGSGVGLAIAKRIVERHGGSIEFNSVLGSGTSFEVSFPRS